MSWLAVGATVVSAAATGYSAYQNAKAAKSAASAMGGQKVGYKKFNPPMMPAYQPVDIAMLNNQATGADRKAYVRSDTDFLKRHPGIVGAERLFEGQVLRDWKGESELSPALQNEFMRGNLAGAMGNLGGDALLTPGSAGEANIARNLGLDIMGFQDRNRRNRMESLVTAEQIFPRRKFGLTGSDVAMLGMTQNLGQNNWNQANYANQFQTAQLNFNNKRAAG